MRLPKLLWFLALAFTLSSSFAPAASPDGLRAAWQDPAAVRSTFFVEGMSCRACSLMLHMHLNKKPGVYWARFNYPLRLLTVYHDPKKVSAGAVAALVDQAKEMRAVHLRTQPAAAFRSKPSAPLATWKGGSAAGADAGPILKPFEDSLREQLGDTEEAVQVRHEILGEAVRNRILLGLAKQAGYPGKGTASRLPEVLAKDFYWPEKLLPLTRDEGGVARFVEDQVLRASKGGDERQRFDQWLLNLWRSSEFEFRGEINEQ